MKLLFNHLCIVVPWSPLLCPECCQRAQQNASQLCVDFNALVAIEWISRCDYVVEVAGAERTSLLTRFLHAAHNSPWEWYLPQRLWYDLLTFSIAMLKCLRKPELPTRILRCPIRVCHLPNNNTSFKHHSHRTSFRPSSRRGRPAQSPSLPPRSLGT